MKRLLVFAITTAVLLATGFYPHADDTCLCEARRQAVRVHLPLIGRAPSRMPGLVRQITVKARLARYKPRSETCDLLAGPVIDRAAQIRILDAETGEVLERGLGEAEAVVYRDTDFAYGISFDPAVAPRRPCPNLLRHTEEWVKGFR